MQLTQAHFMRLYNENHREEFNPIFFQRDNQDIMDSVKKIIMSCERDKYFTLKVLNMREIYDYEEIINLLKDHFDKRKKPNSKEDNPYDFINIRDSDLMLLEVTWFIRHNGTEIWKIDDKDTIVQNPQDIMTVLIALPRFSRKYYLRLNGNYYSDIFQIVDGSTYNNANMGGGKTKKAACNSFKTNFTPIRMFRLYKDMQDVATGTVIRNTMYSTIINLVFNTLSNCMYYLFANFGFYDLCDFLDIRCVQVLDKPILDDRYYNFEKNGIYITYPKECYADPMVQSFAATIYDAIQSDTRIDDIFDIRFWITTLGKSFGNASIDKGLAILDSLDGTYDIITREQLHLPDEYKCNIYQILRWLMREFGYLRKKNNVDVTLKRYRIGEAIAASYAKKLILGLSRVADANKKVTLMGVKKNIYTHPMYVINQIMNMSNLVEYRDIVNDNDATVALKFTYKGISGLGENGTSVQRNYRFVDPSHVGILDLDSSTTSDPGMSGTICPMAKVYPGNSFSEYEEPNFWEEKFKPIQDKWFEENYPKKIEVFKFADQPEKDYQALRKKVVEEALAIDRPICPFYNPDDPTMDFSITGALMREEQNELKNVKSMFTIKNDTEV